MEDVLGLQHVRSQLLNWGKLYDLDNVDELACLFESVDMRNVH